MTSASHANPAPNAGTTRQRFNGKIVLIIGGNSGIGRAAARSFFAEGAKVIITGRRRDTVDTVLAENPGMEGHIVDVVDIASIDAAIEKVRASHGRIDVLFVNAGIGGMMKLETMTVEFWDQLLNVNLRGCVFAAQKALPLIVDGGSILFTGSVATVKVAPDSVAYCAAKAGLRGAARAIGAEVVARGIRVNMLSPGPTDTAIFGRGLNMSADDAAMFHTMAASVTPMRRMAQPEEMAAPALFLSSDEASYITGIELFVDGGIANL